MITVSLVKWGTLLIGTFLGGIAIGCWWTRWQYVVLDRGIHVAFLSTLTEQSRSIQQLEQQLQECSNPTGCLPQTRSPRLNRVELRIWSPQGIRSDL